MRTLAIPIGVLTATDEIGMMYPLQFKALTKNNEDIIIKVDKVESKDLEKFAGNTMLLYKFRL